MQSARRRATVLLGSGRARAPRTRDGVRMALAVSAGTRGHTSLALWDWALVKELTVAQLVREFPASYVTRVVVTVITRSRHRTLSRATYIQPKRSHLVPLT